MYLPGHSQPSVGPGPACQSLAVESGSDGSWLWPAQGPEGRKWWAEAGFELTGSLCSAGSVHAKVWVPGRGQKQEGPQEVTRQPYWERGWGFAAALGGGLLQEGLSSPQVTLRLPAKEEHPPPSLSLTPHLLPLPLPGLQPHQARPFSHSLSSVFSLPSPSETAG